MQRIYVNVLRWWQYLSLVMLLHCSGNAIQTDLDVADWNVGAGGTAGSVQSKGELLPEVVPDE